MNRTPSGNRTHIALFGRVNAGKSSLLNLITGQETALVSAVAGTTTDPVEKQAELLPIGPVQLIDTPGLGDHSTLGDLRRGRTARAFERADVALLVVGPDRWGEPEEFVVARCRAANVPLIAVVTKCDVLIPSEPFLTLVRSNAARVVALSAAEPARRDEYIHALKQALGEVLPKADAQPPLVADLVPPGGVIVLVTPIDAQAPRGRLILPQAQTIRDALDGHAVTVVVTERELGRAIQALRYPPDLVVCDSQVVLQVMEELPLDVRCTTFSILFARAKGDLDEAARGAATLKQLRTGDRVLIAEACTHHALDVDIGRVKIPRWLRQVTGSELVVDVVAGPQFPDSLDGYAAVIHCGGCMLTRREMLHRTGEARAARVAITNYGVAIAFLQGVLARALAPFPTALHAFEKELLVTADREAMTV